MSTSSASSSGRCRHSMYSNTTYSYGVVTAAESYDTPLLRHRCERPCFAPTTASYGSTFFVAQCSSYFRTVQQRTFFVLRFVGANIPPRRSELLCRRRNITGKHQARHHQRLPALRKRNQHSKLTHNSRTPSPTPTLFC